MLKNCLGLFVALLMNSHLCADEPKPNVILIVVDDLGWADLACYGNKFHKTPNLDRLAKDGTRFTQAYAVAPVGTPTQAAILTGRYPQRMSLTADSTFNENDQRHRLKQPSFKHQLPSSEFTLGEMLKSMGYVTACIGKWPLNGPVSDVANHGFEVIVDNEVETAHDSDSDSHGKRIHSLEQAPAADYLLDRQATKAQKFITDHQLDPFLLHLPVLTIKTPEQPKTDPLSTSSTTPTTPNGKPLNQVYTTLVESMDQAVGRVVKTLDDLKLTERTLVLFTSDNGGVCNSNGQAIAPTSNAPLRDGKGHLYEGGIRVPLIVKWPGSVKPDTTNEDVVSCLDLLPTVAEACSFTKTQNSVLTWDGTSLLPLLKQMKRSEQQTLYWHFPHYGRNAGSKPATAIREGDWKLIEFYESGRRELFNVGKEPSESNNQIEKHPDTAKHLAAKLDSWRISVGAKMPTGNTEYEPNPQHDDGTVMLEASSAEVNGVMLRYEPLPNKDTLGFWVRQDDWARFDFTLKRPGQYQIVAHVGCGTNGGSLVHFEVAGHTLPLTVPATGHFQKFEPQELGAITIDKPGRYSIDVIPQKKVGGAVMDLRRIELKPLGL